MGLSRAAVTELIEQSGTKQAGAVRLAVVEDDLAFSSQLNGSMTGMGYTVSTHGMKSAFLRALNSQAFDIGLLDWELPDTDGPGVLNVLRQRKPPLPVVFLSGVEAPLLIAQMLLA